MVSSVGAGMAAGIAAVRQRLCYHSAAFGLFSQNRKWSREELRALLLRLMVPLKHQVANCSELACPVLADVNVMLHFVIDKAY